MMNARHLTRRKSYIEGLPKRAPIPKFLKPSEIEEVQKLKKDHPDQDWDQIVDSVVFRSVPAFRVALRLS